MYTDESINEIKDKAKIIEVVGDYMKLKPKGVNLIGLCPLHGEKTPSFYVSPAKNIYKCFGCNKGGDSVQFLMEHENLPYIEALKVLSIKYNIPLVDEKSHVYIQPTWNNKTALSTKVVEWFEKRKISQKTLLLAKVTDGPEWMPGPDKVVHTIQFNSFVNDILENIKYRDNKKNFKLHKGSKLVFYNIDSLKGKKEGFIVEGEPDALSLIEAGYVNDLSGVVSVPNGATKGKNNLSYIDNCIKEIEHIERWHIGVDDDINGRKLREELAERFGKDKCDYIVWKGKKDANEILVAEDIQGVIDCCSAPINFPIEGVFTIDDFDKPLDDMYTNGLDKGVDLRIPGFELNVVKGYLSVIYGIPSHGKSDWVDYMALNMVRYAQWKGAFYSPENRPTELHISKLARKLVGKHWDGNSRISVDELKQAKAFLNKKIWFIKPAKNFNLTSILNHIRQLQISYGLDFFIIDAWNKLEHKESDTAYIGRALDQVVDFCANNKLHCFMVAHPTKMKKQDSRGKDSDPDQYEIPRLYDISGSSTWYDKADNGICVYRDFKANQTKIYRQKIKFDHWGTEGYSTYKYNVASKRYYQEGFPDFKNWITGENNVFTKEIKEQNQTQVYFDFDDTEPPPF